MAINVRDAAELLGVHVNTIGNWLDSGQLTGYRLRQGGAARFEATEVLRMQGLLAGRGALRVTIVDQADAHDKVETDWPPTWRIPAQGEVLRIRARLFEVDHVEWRLAEGDARSHRRVVIWGSWRTDLLDG